MPPLASLPLFCFPCPDDCSTGSLQGCAMPGPVGLVDPMSNDSQDNEDSEGRQSSLLECLYCSVMQLPAYPSLWALQPHPHPPTVNLWGD